MPEFSQLKSTEVDSNSNLVSVKPMLLTHIIMLSPSLSSPSASEKMPSNLILIPFTEEAEASINTSRKLEVLWKVHSFSARGDLQGYPVIPLHFTDEAT